MRRLVTAVVLSVVVTALFADDITTKDGTVYTNARITRVEPDGITVMWSSGIAKLGFEQLPQQLQEEHGYDPEKAAAYVQDVAEERQAAAQSRARRAQLAAQAAEIEKQKKTLHGKVLQNTSDGLLLQCDRPRRPRRSTPDRMARVGGFIGSSRSFVLEDKTAQSPPTVYGTFLLVGHPKQTELVDGSPVTIIAYPAGTYSYASVIGAQSTVQRFSVSLQDAVSLLTMTDR